MTGRKSIVGLCMLCALVFSAFAAQSASAAGTTAFTCVEVAPKAGVTAGFKTTDCKEATEVGENVHSEHKEITTKTNLSGTGGITKLHSVISGVEVELEATSVSGSGSMENALAGGVMEAKGTGTITYEGVTAIKPAGIGCKVFENEALTVEKMVSTKELKAATVEEKALKFEPAGATPFAEFWISGCSITALNGKYTVTGSVKSTEISGTSTVFTAANTTGQGTLKLRAQVAGINGTLNLKGEGTALAVTK